MILLTPVYQETQSPAPAVICVREHSQSAQGNDGRAVDARLQTFKLDLESRNVTSKFLENSDIEYRSVDFESVGRIAVRYREAQQLRPRVFSFYD